MQVIRLLITLAIVVGLSAQAADIRETGRATIDMRGRKARVEETRRAIDQAKINALERWVERSTLKLDLYDRCLREDIASTIDDFVGGYEVLREDARSSSRQLTVVIKAEITDSRLSLALERCKGSGQRRNRIAFVFLARQQTGPGEFEAPAVDIGVEASVEQVFLENKFLVTSTTQMEDQYRRYRRAAIADQFAGAGTVNWKDAEDAAEFMGNDFAVFGTFDIGVPTVDPKTKWYRVNVIGQAQLTDLQYDAKLAVTGRMPESALRPTVEEAVTTAFTLAAEKVAKRMVDQINAQGYN